MKVKNYEIHSNATGRANVLNKRRFLVGSADNCDLIIKSDTVSSYHCILIVDKDGVFILDIDSANGTYVNGNLVNKSLLSDEDVLTVGDHTLRFLETFTGEDVNIEEEKVTKIEPRANHFHFAVKNKDTEVLIDGEYCDIVFDEIEYSSLLASPLEGIAFNQDENYEGLEQALDITQAHESEWVVVSTLLNGHIVDQHYVKRKSGIIYAYHHNDAKKNIIQIDVLSESNPTPLVEITDTQIILRPLEGYQVNGPRSSLEINEALSGMILSCTNNAFEVQIGMTLENEKVIPNIWQIYLARNKEFLKETAKSFSVFMIPLLLLTLVDTDVEKKKDVKKVSFVYKMEPQKEAIKRENPTAQKTASLNPKQVSEKPPVESTAKVQPKQAERQDVAKTKSEQESTFELDLDINSLVSDKNTETFQKSARSLSALSESDSNDNSLAEAIEGSVSDSLKTGDVQKLSTGSLAADYGPDGFASGEGADTSSIQTETVVLGSMDPELLRKILRRYLPQFRHCYQQELAYNSDDIQGVVDLNFEIKGSGKVAKINVQTKDSRFSNKGTDCMKKVLSIIRFPKPKGGGTVAVRQPLNFFSDKEKG